MTSRFKSVTLGNETYQIPQSGCNPPWGEELSDLLDALVEVANLTSGIADITETSATILNTSGEKDITGLAFDPAKVRSAEISYNISRTITKTISTIPTGSGTIQIDCANVHDLHTGDVITIAGSDSTPSINGQYTITKVDAHSFTIPIGTPVTVAGSTGTFQVELVESGSIMLNYGQQGWSMSMFGDDVGNTQVLIDFNTSGQGRYTPTVLEGINHSGLMKFIAKSLLDT